MKLLKKIAICSVIITLALAVVGCSTPASTQSETQTTQSVSVESVEVIDKLEMVVGDEVASVETVVSPEGTDARLIYKSSNVMVATVDQEGFVKAVSAGECTIITTAKSGEVTLTVETNVVVTAPEVEE